MTRKRKRSPGSSFWTTAPGIMTGVAALVTAITGVVALLARDRPARPPSPAPATSLSRPRSTGAIPSCMDAVFAGIPSDRIRAVARDARDVVIVGPEQPKRDPAGIVLRDGEVIAAIRLTFDPEPQVFRIERIVGASCAPVDEWRNESRPGATPGLLSNWDDLRLRVGSTAYVLTLGYGQGEITVNSFRRIVE